MRKHASSIHILLCINNMLLPTLIGVLLVQKLPTRSTCNSPLGHPCPLLKMVMGIGIQLPGVSKRVPSKIVHLCTILPCAVNNIIPSYCPDVVLRLVLYMFDSPGSVPATIPSPQLALSLVLSPISATPSEFSPNSVGSRFWDRQPHLREVEISCAHEQSASDVCT